jgi:hypothetical protein
MSRVIGIPWTDGWASRAHRFPIAIALRRLLVLGFILLALVWLLSVGVLIHDMVSWWAEFAVRPILTASEGPPPGW